MSRIDYLSQVYGERLVNAISFSPYVPVGVDITNNLSILNHLTTYNVGNKIQWVVLRLIDHNIRLEDLDRVQQALQSFDQVKSRLPSKDINSYRTLADLEDAISALGGEQVLSTKQQNKLIKLEGAEYIIDSKDFKILHIKTGSAAQFYGCGTRWCTAARSNNIFEHYNRQGEVYIILAGDRKFQFHYQSQQFMDERDSAINKTDIAYLSQYSQWATFLDIMIEKHYGHYF